MKDTYVKPKRKKYSNNIILQNDLKKAVANIENAKILNKMNEQKKKL